MTSNLGYHITYLPFNETHSIEPRAALSYQNKNNSTLSLAVGLHSKPEHISTYFFQQTPLGGMPIENKNKNLEIPKSLHAVLGYKFKLSPKLHASAEAYYQYQYDLPVEGISQSSFATVNAEDIWDIIDTENLVSDGLGRNYGVDLSVSRPFQDGFYITANGSLFKSEFRTFDGDWFETQFSRNYTSNVLLGKEYQLKKKNRIFGINFKSTVTGGLRETPVDFEASQAAGESVRPYDQTYAEQVGSYYRFDIGISYKVNRKRLTHTILFDIQNFTNHLNIQGRFYDEDEQQIETYYQTGLFPFINYRVEFQGKRKGLVKDI